MQFKLIDEIAAAFGGIAMPGMLQLGTFDPIARMLDMPRMRKLASFIWCFRCRLRCGRQGFADLQLIEKSVRRL